MTDKIYYRYEVPTDEYNNRRTNKCSYCRNTLRMCYIFWRRRSTLGVLCPLLHEGIVYYNQYENGNIETLKDILDHKGEKLPIEENIIKWL